MLEEELAQGLKKLCRSSHEAARRSDGRQGSYARSYEDLSRIHDRMADNGIQFALSLHQMHDDLQDLAIEKERGRKQWKQSGLNAERRVQDLEAAAEKAKLKSSSLSDEYDRARTGDKQPGRFGLKGPKSAAQVEEDLHRKFQAAESDYATKIQVAQNMRRDLVTIIRPQALQALQHLINECDCGLDLQMQKFGRLSYRKHSVRRTGTKAPASIIQRETASKLWSLHLPITRPSKCIRFESTPSGASNKH